MAEFSPQTKYDIGQQYYAVVAGLLAESAEYGKRVDNGDARAIRMRLSTLKQWTRCISAIIDDDEYAELMRLAKLSEPRIKDKRIQNGMKIIDAMNDMERELYCLMKKYKMLTKMEHSISGMDRARASLNIVGKPRGNTANFEV